ncbi:unnamed protein product [Brassica oleracea]
MSDLPCDSLNCSNSLFYLSVPCSMAVHLDLTVTWSISSTQSLKALREPIKRSKRKTCKNVESAAMYKPTRSCGLATNPVDWPTFASELEMFQRLHEDFEDVSVSHIPRSRNGRADSLAKEARTKGYIFFHIDQTRPDGGTLWRIDWFDHHLI